MITLKDEEWHLIKLAYFSTDSKVELIFKKFDLTILFEWISITLLPNLSPYLNQTSKRDFSITTR